MPPNDFDDSPFVCIIGVSYLPSTPSRFGPLGGIVLLRRTIRWSADYSFHSLFDPSPTGLRVLNKGWSKSFQLITKCAWRCS
ncbi:hypothetical protein H5410_064127, partial [Solanum commersonii]